MKTIKLELFDKDTGLKIVTINIEVTDSKAIGTYIDGFNGTTPLFLVIQDIWNQVLGK